MPDNTVTASAKLYYAPRSLFYFFLCFSVSLLGAWWADYILMNQDMASIVEFAQQMLWGKRLYVDLITSQPPLIMYFTMPAIFINHITGIPMPEAFLLYLFILFQFCTLLSWRIAKRNMLCQTAGQAWFILFSFYCTVFILPSLGQKFMSVFSQREHIFCVAILPYVMLAVNRLQGNEGSRFEQAAAGILGAIGFCVKPQFLLIFAFSEIFMMASSRRFLAWNRPDAWIIIIFSLLYALFIVFFTPEYIHLIPRLALDYQGYKSVPWELMFLAVDLSVVAPAMVVFRLRGSPHFRILSYLLVLIIGAEIIFFLPRLYAFYHLFPVFFLSFLLFTFAALASKKTLHLFLVIPAGSLYVLAQADRPDFHHIIQRREEILAEAALLSQYKTIDALNSDNMLYFPMITYAGAKWDMTTAYLEYLPGAYSQYNEAYQFQEPPYHAPEHMTENERFFHERIMKDLERLPDAIIIDENLLKPGFTPMQFDYLHYFMLDPRFRQIWPHYELVTYFHRKYSNSYLIPVNTYDAIYRRKD